MPNSDFNNEVVWGDNRKLFDIYFKQNILNDRSRISFTNNYDEKLGFDKNVEKFKRG